jgi:DNA-binding NtrC family response regulator
MASILCVDDEPSVGVVLEHLLSRLNHTAVLASSVDEAMRIVRHTPLDLVIADYRMPGQTGLDLLNLLEKEGYRLPVIIMTGFSTIEHAVISIKSGAVDYLTKPVQAENLEIAVTQALEVSRLRRENARFRSELKKAGVSRSLIGQSESFRRVMETIATVAPTPATVLLEGESGTGKELFARAIHDQSQRADGPFVTINCAALPEGLVESALFGHEKGAFTGATVRTAGAFERAHGGTLLLDEVSEMRLDLQAKLLRAIQEREFERVGGTQAIKVDVRLVATTNRDLQAEVDAGKFRSDLYYRLNVIPIRTPPLRERQDDIPFLVHHFVQRTAQHLETTVPDVADDALKLLSARQWPGNVRELANVVERAVILSHGQPISADRLRAFLKPERNEQPAADTPAVAASLEDIPLNLGELERLMISRALSTTGGNRTRAAQLLGISERTLRNKLNTPKV